MTTRTLPQRTVLGAVMRYWKFVLIIGVLGALMGAAYGLAFPSIPGATAIIVVSDPKPGAATEGSATARYGAEQAILLSADLVLDPTRAELLGRRPPIDLSAQEIRSRLVIGRSDTSNAITVSVTDPDRNRAAIISNAIVHAYRAVISNQIASSSRAQLTNIDSSLDALDKQVAAGGHSATADVARASKPDLLALRAKVLAQVAGGDGLTAFSPASPPPDSRSISALIRPVGLTGLIALLAGVFLVYLLASRRRRFEEFYEPEVLLEVPCLGVLDRRDPVASFASRDFMTTAAKLMVRQERQAVWSIGLLSHSADEAAGDAMVGVAAAAGRLGMRVLLILSHTTELSPAARSVLGGTGAVAARGVETSLDVTLATTTVLVSTDARIQVAWSDATSVGDYLRNTREEGAGDERFDIVLVDVLPTAGGDETQLPLLVDTNLVIVRHNSPVDVVQDIGDSLRMLNVSMIGYIYVIAPRRRRRIGGSAGSTSGADEQSTESSSRLRQLVDVRKAAQG